MQFFGVGPLWSMKNFSEKCSSSFHKGYEIQNNQELFQIHKILTNLPIPMYQLQSMEKPEEGVIKGHFYGNEPT